MLTVKHRFPRTIVATGARLAAHRGLEGLPIGHLAGELGMSKGGLYAHFDSKQDLQLATIDAAEAAYTAQVVAPASVFPGVETRTSRK